MVSIDSSLKNISLIFWYLVTLFNPAFQQATRQTGFTLPVPPPFSYANSNRGVSNQNGYIGVNSVQGFTLPPSRPLARRPVATQPVVQYSDNAIAQNVTMDCNSPSLTICTQKAWGELGVALAGLKQKTDICVQYMPATSCVSKSLLHCSDKMNAVSKKMLQAIGAVIVSWCENGGRRLIEANRFSGCYAGALLFAVTVDNCMKDENPARTALVGYSVAKETKAGLNNMGLLNSLVGFYQISSIICLHKNIEITCGQLAAALATGPAMPIIDYTEVLTATEKTKKSPNHYVPENAFKLDNIKMINDSSRHRPWILVNSGLIIIISYLCTTVH